MIFIVFNLIKIFKFLSIFQNKIKSDKNSKQFEIILCHSDIFISYIGLSDSTEKRREKLSKYYHFHCICLR